MNVCDKPGDIGERGCMTSTSSGPIWWHGSCSALLRRLAFAGHFKDGGRALLHLTDLQNLRKNPIFLRDLIPSDCAPALSKITLRGSGGSGRQPTFGGQHHLCLISFGVGFIFTLKRYNLLFDNLDPLQWLLQISIMYCKRQFKASNDLPTQLPRSLLKNCRFQIWCKKISVWQMSDGGIKDILKGWDWEIWQQFNNFIWQLWQQPLDTKSSCWDKKFWVAFF